MLSKKQWQWLADHDVQVRNFSTLALVIGSFLYLGLVIKTGVDSGKGITPYGSATYFMKSFDCFKLASQTQMHSPGGNAPAKPGYYQDANSFKFERHWTFMYDSRLLLQSPECVWAMMADQSNSPDPFVIILYDTKTNRPLYRIARLDDVLKR